MGAVTDGSIYSCTSGVWVSTAVLPCVHGSVTYSTPGTYSLPKPTGNCKFTVTAIGGGGAGGSSVTYNQWSAYSAAGGSAGSYASNTQVALDGSSSYTIVVGAGAGNWTSCTGAGQCAPTNGYAGAATYISTALSGVIFSVAGGAGGIGTIDNCWSCANTSPGGDGAPSAFGLGGAGGAQAGNCWLCMSPGNSAPAASFGAGGGGAAGHMGYPNWNGWAVAGNGAGAGGYISITW